MSLISQEESYLTVDCKECNFNLLLVHNHDDRQVKLIDIPDKDDDGYEIDLSQWGPPDNVPYEV
jgi:hypothetical protein